MSASPTLEIVFGVQDEIDRVLNTIKKLPWYKEQGYSESFAKLPKGITEGSNLESIESVIKESFNAQKYEEYKDHIELEWPKVSPKLVDLKDIPSFHLNNHYTLLLTQYGSGGSYDSKQGLIISNIAVRQKNEIMGTIIHELVHIGVQHLIDKYNVRHWHKERLVGLLVDRFFPGLQVKQNIKEDTDIVDAVFLKHFPDLEKITSSI